MTETQEIGEFLRSRINIIYIHISTEKKRLYALFSIFKLFWKTFSHFLVEILVIFVSIWKHWFRCDSSNRNQSNPITEYNS